MDGPQTSPTLNPAFERVENGIPQHAGSRCAAMSLVEYLYELGKCALSGR
jgi:hypothetical protein